MHPARLAPLLSLFPLLLGHRELPAQSEFSMLLRGPQPFLHPEGALVRDRFTSTLNASLASGPSAHGWSFGVRATGGSIVAITTEGTVAGDGGLFQDGFRRSELTVGAGNEGAVSTVILAPDPGVVLPKVPFNVVAFLDVEVRFEDGKRLLLEPVDGLRDAAGEPVLTRVLAGGEWVLPRLFESSFPFEVLRCDEGLPEIHLGFSTANLNEPVPFAGILGAEGAGGGSEVRTRRGETGQATVYANLISELEGSQDPFGIDGWSLSMAVTGEASPTLASIDDTAGFIAHFNCGFRVVAIVDPAINGGQRGVVSAFASLCGRSDIGLPRVGTHSVLRIDLTADAPQGDAPSGAGVRPADGLRGSGSPVTSSAQLDGRTVLPCNLFEASLALRFVPSPHRFLRGNANHDARIDLSDAIRVFNYLFVGAPPSPCAASADANGDGVLDIPDPVTLLYYQLTGGPPPAPPFPDCGDGTGGLTCEAHQDLCG